MKKYLSLVKFAHTIFALPFAFLGFVLAVNSEPGEWSMRKLILVVLCMVFARSAAMAFNRLIDREIDAKNQRTASREIPAGEVTPTAARIFVILNAILFIVTTYFINQICFYLSPVALLVILGYSLTKRFTFLCHFILGLGLSFAPIGAYLAVTGQFAVLPVLYGFIVLLWVSGFDIIYALQDDDFDRSLSLHSVPVFFGRKNGLLISTLLHAICALLLIVTSYMLGQTHPELQWIHWVGSFIFIALLIYQHLIIKPGDLTKVNLAFFTTNGVASVLFTLFVILDFYL
jgi:4-hydroxybenzoate polyprenyltransferase